MLFFYKTEPKNLTEELRQKKFLSSAIGRFLSAVPESFEQHGNSTRATRSTKLRIRIKRRKLSSEYIEHPILPTKSQEEFVSAYWAKIFLEKWSPSTRQQGTITACNSSLYLIGGISRTISQDIHIYSAETKDWIKIQTSSSLEPRYGHTALAYQNSILIFGGGTYFNSVHRLRECLNGVRKLTIPSHSLSYLKTSGTFIPARKGHVAGILGKHMLVSGGFNDKQHILNDCAILNLVSFTWSYLEITNLGLLAKAYPASCTVTSNSSSQSIYKLTENEFKNFGIFVFGGLDCTKKPSSELVNIVPGTRPVRCETVETTGRPPSPRFMHSMVFSRQTRHLIVFGGRVDLKEAKEYTCFSDVYLLNIDSLVWAVVKITGTVPAARSGHCAEMINNEMFVFGGVSNSFYCSSDIFKLSIGTEGRFFKDLKTRNKSMSDRFD